MERRSCSHLHFVQAIRCGLDVKICNLNSRGRPALVFKKVNDIYKTTDPKKLDTLSYPSIVERKTMEIDPVINKLNYSGSDDEKDCDSDEFGFGKMTLKQLKQSCKTKKRKASNFVGLIPKQEFTSMQPEEEDFELELPLSNWKSKLSKNPKAKRKCIRRSVSISSKAAISVNSEQILGTEDSLQYSADLCAPIPVTAEVTEPEYSKCQYIICGSDQSAINCDQQVGFSGVASGEILETVNHKLKNENPIFIKEECQSRVVNGASYDHLEHMDPTSPLLLISGKDKKVETHENTCQQNLFLPVPEFKTEGYINHSLSYETSLETVSPAKDQSSYMCKSSRTSFYLHDIAGQSPQTSRDSQVQTSDKEIDVRLCCAEPRRGGELYMSEDEVNKYFPPNLENGSLSSSNNYNSSWDSHPCLSPDNGLVFVDDSRTTEEMQPSISTIVNAEGNCLNPDIELVVLEADSSTTEEKQPLLSFTVDAERSSSTSSQSCDVVNKSSTSKIRSYHCLELSQPPERLLSTRKAISPTSQENLCLAMKSIETDDEVDHYKCMEKLWFEKPTVNKASSAGSDIEGIESSINPRELALINGNKEMIIAKQILKKTKTIKKASPSKKGSPLKGSFEGPRLSRSLPRLSTGCTSIQGCSESAIVFSQRQMQDIKFVAMNLMAELKSMKDIVEEKMLYEAYRNSSSKNDADEVKIAIKRATKSEDTARKWLSIMARDCNRFCKIMNLTEDSAATSENEILKVSKKITFADEAGGMLCHVKLFENGMASEESKGEEQLVPKGNFDA